MGQRLAVFSVLGRSVALVSDWAESAGHEVAILVTVPGPRSNPDQHLSTIASARRHTLALVVPELTSSEAALRGLEVDLGIVLSFPKIPESAAIIPRHGTVNVHPALLPAYRGKNAFRALYEGERQTGATLHRVTEDFDAGPILCQASRPTPDDVEPATALETMQAVITDVLETGVPRALGDEPGEDQDASAVSFAPGFSEEEAELDLGLSAYLLQCRASALILSGVQPWVVLDGERLPVRAVRRLPGLTADKPGLVAATSRRAIVAVADAVSELEIGKLPF